MAQHDQIHTLKELNVSAAPWNPTMPPSPPASTHALADHSERSSPSPTTHPLRIGPPSPHYANGIDIPQTSPWPHFSTSSSSSSSSFIWNESAPFSPPEYHYPRTPRPSFSTESTSHPSFLPEDQLWSKHVLATTHEEENEPEPVSHPRMRSKSSTAAFGMIMDSSPLDPIGQSIWSRQSENMTPHRRRSSTSVGWHPMATTRSPPSINSLYNSSSSILNQSPLSATLPPRSDQWMAHQRSSTSEYMPPAPYRRHSVATTPSLFPTHQPQDTYQLTDMLDKVHLDDPNKTGLSHDVLETIHGYFENDRQRTQIFNDMGKGIPLDQVPAAGALYMVEFKAGRSDLYYVADISSCPVKHGDLVIVEADRGKDLGKIIVENLTPEYVESLAIQKEQQQQQQDGTGEDGQDSKELRPKQIYRKAVPAEVAMLLSKRQDEIKAVMVCQTKTRQKRLPMEVVDAEFQWDRRKLTFYFVAERRIDFRELVRDLFKTYKTRIWMCAVNPSTSSN
ncbi:unnamed protein product [Umbelopsis ramanniana]